MIMTDQVNKISFNGAAAPKNNIDTQSDKGTHNSTPETFLEKNELFAENTTASKDALFTPSNISLAKSFNKNEVFSSKPFAEIIESSLHSWLAQSWLWNEMPAFGSLVTVTTPKRTLFGLVQSVQTGSLDPMRHPFPYKKTHEELMAEQPQIFEFLKTSFSAFCIGYQERGTIYYLTAPEPPLIHSFVTPCPQQLAAEFFSHNGYLPMLFSIAGQTPTMDDLLLALLKQRHTYHPLSEEALTDFTTIFSLATGNDYRRLKLFLQRLQPILTR